MPFSPLVHLVLIDGCFEVDLGLCGFMLELLQQLKQRI